MSFDTAILISSLLLETVLLILLMYRRVWRDLPIFCLYAASLLVSDSVAGAVILFRGSASVAYGRIYLAETAIDWVVNFLVLVEVGIVILRRTSFYEEQDPRWIVAASLGLLGWLSWMAAAPARMAYFTPVNNLFFRMQLTKSYLTIAAVISLVVCSRIFSIRWKDLERRVGSGLATLCLIQVLVIMVHSHQVSYRSDYHFLDQVDSASYECVLVYWIIGLAKDRKRLAAES